MENISSEYYGAAYFAEEEEIKMGIHPSQIIPRATIELKSRGYNVDDIFIWDWNSDTRGVKVKFNNGSSVIFDYTNNQIIENDSDLPTSKHEYLLDWVHGLYDVPLYSHINDYNKLHPNDQITRDDVGVVKGMVSICLNSHYGSCSKNHHVNRKSLDEKLKARILIKSYMPKYQQICDYLKEKDR